MQASIGETVMHGPLPGAPTAASALPPEVFPEGIVWALQIRPGGGAAPINAAELAAPATVEGWVWVHYDSVHHATRPVLAGHRRLPEDARRLLTGPDRNAQIDAEDGCVYGALPAFDDSMATEDKALCAWRFAALPNLLITTRRSPVRSLANAYKALLRGEAMAGPAELIDRALTEFAEAVRQQVSLLDDSLDGAEDDLLSEDESDLGALGPAIGRARRSATELKRVLVPVNRMFNSDALELPDWAADDIYDRARRQLHAALDDLTALQDRARSLQDELGSRQNEQTNQRLYIVSVVTTLMLPATFVTGFFGMNTGGMFLSSGHHGTVAAGGVCLLFMLATYLILKVGKLL